jgi:hypothetical protein
VRRNAEQKRKERERRQRAERKPHAVEGCASYESLAEVFGISRHRVIQIERAALKKLRDLIIADHIMSQMAAEVGYNLDALEGDGSRAGDFQGATKEAITTWEQWA